METAMQNPDIDFYPEDYQHIDNVFDVCEGTMLQLAADHRLLGSRIERWRWDVPDITMSWNEPGRYLFKNLRVLVNKKGENDYDYVVDINAWVDHGYAGIATERMWNNLSRDVIPGSQEEWVATIDVLTTAMREQFATVAAWTTEDLKRHHLFHEVER